MKAHKIPCSNTFSIS